MSSPFTFHFEVFHEDENLDDLKYAILTQDHLSDIYPVAQLLTERSKFNQILSRPELSLYSHIFLKQNILTDNDASHILCDALWIEEPGLLWGGVAKITLSSIYDGVLIQVQESYVDRWFTKKIDLDGFKKDLEGDV